MTASTVPTFNEANLLEKSGRQSARRGEPATPFVTNIDYNAKGQRTLIEYGNGVRTQLRIRPADLPPDPSDDHPPAGLNGLATQLFKDAARCRI